MGYLTRLEASIAAEDELLVQCELVYGVEARRECQSRLLNWERGRRQGMEILRLMGPEVLRVIALPVDR